MTARMAGWWNEEPTTMTAFDGRSVACKGDRWVELKIGGERLETKVTVVESIMGNVDVVLGMDVIKQMGGVTVAEGSVQFGRVMCAIVNEEEDGESLGIVDKDFEAKFNGKEWTVRYMWKEGREPTLKGKVAEYEVRLDQKEREAYDREVD